MTAFGGHGQLVDPNNEFFIRRLPIPLARSHITALTVTNQRDSEREREGSDNEGIKLLADDEDAWSALQSQCRVSDVAFALC